MVLHNFIVIVFFELCLLITIQNSVYFGQIWSILVCSVQFSSLWYTLVYMVNFRPIQLIQFISVQFSVFSPFSPLWYILVHFGLLHSIGSVRSLPLSKDMRSHTVQSKLDTSTVQFEKEMEGDKRLVIVQES